MTKNGTKPGRAISGAEACELSTRWYRAAFSEAQDDDPTLTEKVLGSLMDVSQATVSKVLGGTRKVQARHVLGAPRTLAVAWLRRAAAHHGCLVIDAPETEGTALEHYASLTRVGKETSDVTAAYYEALADEELSPSETAELIREHDEAIEALCASRERLRRTHEARGELVAAPTLRAVGVSS